MIVNVDYHVTEVCNLNCAHCSHFCPLVPKDTKPKSIEQITADFALLSKFKEHLETLGLMKGDKMNLRLGELLRKSGELSWRLHVL